MCFQSAKCLSCRGFFDTRRGKVSVGLAILSGGGLLITQAQMHIKDPNLNSALQFLLVFWWVNASA